ncbi:MAG: tRNA pseudouridine(13) synthase TruD [Candidatus Ranarchaeia archaeon]
MITPPPLEVELGLEHYGTLQKGIGGKLRHHFEDFQVVELREQNVPVTDLPVPDQKGNFLILLIRKEGVESMEVVSRLARFLHVRNSDISISGNKDKRAVTTQLVSVKGVSSESLTHYSHDRFSILKTWYYDKPIALGSHWGNRFKITIRNTNSSADEIHKRITKFQDQSQKTGIPNFFGHQRFGVQRPITAKVGEALLKGTIKEAVWLYLSKWSELEKEDARTARQKLAKEQDPKDALEYFPKRLYYERQILAYLTQHPGDFEGALRTFSKQQRLLFVHAYQSLIFNKTLSARAELKLSFLDPIEGDFVAGFDHRGLLTKNTTEVTSKNKDIVQTALKKGQIVLVGPVVGSSSTLPSNVWGEKISRILKEYAIEPMMFKSPILPELSSKGVWRPVGLSPKAFSYSVLHDKEDQNQILAILSFDLPKGTYATVVLREIMKAYPTAYV